MKFRLHNSTFWSCALLFPVQLNLSFFLFSGNGFWMSDYWYISKPPEFPASRKKVLRLLSLKFVLSSVVDFFCSVSHVMICTSILRFISLRAPGSLLNSSGDTIFPLLGSCLEDRFFCSLQYRFLPFLLSEMYRLTGVCLFGFKIGVGLFVGIRF